MSWAENHFEVFITIDRKLERQNNLAALQLGFVVARVPNNALPSYLPIFTNLREAAEAVKPGEVVYVWHPKMRA